MLAHVAVNVTNLEAAESFYMGALEPLGYRVVYEDALAYVLDLDGNNIEAVCHHAPA